MITIVDYGMGNVGSIQSMFRRIGVRSMISRDPDEIRQAEKILLPGVGNFDAAMRRIDERGLREPLNQQALRERVPTLGICLGMQLLTRGSEEGTLSGLGWIMGEARRFPSLQGLKVPHMGWNAVQFSRDSALTTDLPGDSRFYFVHSFYVCTDSPDETVLTADYGVRFSAAIEAGNIFGAQFHPEKSHKFGMRVLANFAAI